jgi:hypothetical protein
MNEKRFIDPMTHGDKGTVPLKHQIQKDLNPHKHHCENLKSHYE